MSIPHGHRKTTTFIAGLRLDGMVAPMVLDGPINGDWFEAYVAKVLAPTLRPGDTVIMDMCGRPLWSKQNLGRRMACRSGADMCPASDAAVTCRGPVWEFADRVQNNLARSRRLSMNWLTRPRLTTVAPYSPSTQPCSTAPRDPDAYAATVGAR
jgi:hypothetical protein